MKFNEGAWRARQGYKLHTAKQIIEYTYSADSIHLYVLCGIIKPGTVCSHGTALEYIFTSPRTNTIRVHINHFSGVVKKGPFFTLNEQTNIARVEETDIHLILYSGDSRVEINKAGILEYHFYYKDRLLTCNGGTTYITDFEYEAHRLADFNYRKLSRGYMCDTYLRERLKLSIDEKIYGLGERFLPLVRNGQSVDVWNRDCGCTNNEQGYKNIPFHLSSRGYGILVNTPQYVNYEIATESTQNTAFSVEGEELEYILLGADSPLGVMSEYTALTGRTPVPPAWSFGLWLSTSWVPEPTAGEILEIIDKMSTLGIPLSVFHFDARWMADFHDCNFQWHPRYGDAREMLRKIHDRGIKVCCWINPYVSQASRLFAEGAEKGYFIKKSDGSIYQTDDWMIGMAYVDFTNIEASKWYCERLEEILDMGVDAIKTDFGERIPTDVVYFDGSDPRRMHNYYPYLYNKTIYELLKQKYGERDACVFARSATVGTQQFPINWGGDNEATYSSMADTLRGCLSLCQSGFGFSAHDISGFMGTATPDLYNRWVAFGMLSTHSRLHGNKTLRMPWCFDEQCCDVLRHFTRLKCSLMPYIFEQAVNVNLYGYPEMRAMSLEFPDDPNCQHLELQYMLGSRLMIAPIFNKSGSVRFYVPKGRWTDFQTGEVFYGERYYTRTYDYMHLPILVRPNSIIPVGNTDNSVEYDYAKESIYRIYELEAFTECHIYSEKAEEILKIVAVRNGDRISVSTFGDRTEEKYKIQLIGVKRITAMQNVQCEENPQGVLLISDIGTSIDFVIEDQIHSIQY